MTENDYKKLRDKFHPKKLRIIFLLESPPLGGNYFYKTTGLVSESLFSAMMTDVLHIKRQIKTKKEGLEKFAKRGYLLVDATYSPVNDIRNYRKRDRKILANYFNLIKDLRNLIKSKNIKIILIKTNICRLLEMPLIRDGFNVVNKGIIIPFPANGWQIEFRRKIKRFL